MAQHIIFGAGLIGCYVGGALKAGGGRVSFVGRSSIAEALSSGLTLTDYQGNKARVEGLDFLSGPPTAQADVIWLTVKCTGLTNACQQMQEYVGPDTLIICCQNGVGSDALVKKAFPRQKVMRAMVPFNVAKLADDHYHRGSEGALTLETGIADELLSQLKHNLPALLPLKTSTHMTALQWAKLQLNLANGVNALADIPVKAMLEQRPYRRVIAALMDELLQVTKNQGLPLPKLTALPATLVPSVLRLPDGIFRLVAAKMLAIDPTVRTSMWWDLHQHKPTEIDYLNGAVVQAGKKCGIATPVNARLCKLIKAVENGQAKQGITAEKLAAQLLHPE